MKTKIFLCIKTLIISICTTLLLFSSQTTHAGESHPASITSSLNKSPEKQQSVNNEYSTAVTVGLSLLSKTDINIRMEASTDSPIVYTVPSNAELLALSNVDNNWIKVLYQKDCGYTGFIKADYAYIKEGQDLSVQETDGKITEITDDGFYFQNSTEEPSFFPHPQLCEYYPSFYQPGDQIKLRYRENTDNTHHIISMDLLDKNGKTQEREKEVTGIISYKDNKQIELSIDKNKKIRFDLATAKSLPEFYETGYRVCIFYFGDIDSPEIVSMYRLD